jgi:hypothetical protein
VELLRRKLAQQIILLKCVFINTIVKTKVIYIVKKKDNQPNNPECFKEPVISKVKKTDDFYMDKSILS